MKCRSLSIQKLNSRLLMAADALPETTVTQPTEFTEAAEVSPPNTSLQTLGIFDEINVNSRLMTGVSEFEPIVMGDLMLAGGRDYLNLYSRASSSSGWTLTSQLDIAGDVGGIQRIGERFVFVSHVGDQESFVQTTTVYLVGINEAGQLEVEDQVSRLSDGAGFSVDGDQLVVKWILNPLVAGSEAEFAEATFESSRASRGGQQTALELFVPDSDSLGRRGFFSSGKFSSQFYAHAVSPDTTLLVEGEKLYLITNASGSVAISEIERPESIATIRSVDAYDTSAGTITISGGVYVGELPVYGETVLNTDGEVLSQVYDSDLKQAELQLADVSTRMLFSNGLTDNVTVYPGIGNTRQISVVTRNGDQFDEQKLSLPYRRFGFRPAFVINDDTIVVIRANVAAWETNPELIPTGRPDLWAYLLKRSESGAFIIVSTEHLGEVELPSQGFAEGGGTVTIQGEQQSRIVRVQGNELTTESVSNSFDSVAFAFPDVTLIRDQGVLNVSPNTSFSSLDTNRDGHVTALDALIVINALNLRSGESEPLYDESLDVNQDFNVTALDALMIINELNRQSSRVDIPISTINREDGINDKLVDESMTTLF